jgi:tetratricopeptide (TPR) repeat protein
MVDRFFIVPLLLIVFAALDVSAAQLDGCLHCKASHVEVAELIKQADRLHAEFKPREAAALQKVLQADPGNLEALAKQSRAYIDIGDSIPESQSGWQESRIRAYRSAENYARRAIRADPNSTWGYFFLAASLGTMAGVSPVAKQIEMADEIRAAAEKAIALDPQNGFAHHVYGVWHRRMVEIGNVSRVLAAVWYGQSLPQGSLEKSIQLLKKAVAINPDVIVSRLELARSHAAREEWSAARLLLKSIAKISNQFSDDARHKQEAAELLEQIKDR